MKHSFEDYLNIYAKLVIHTGLKVKKDDPVQILGQVDQAPLIRLVSESAYQAGAKKVFIQWRDDQSNRLDQTYQSIESLTEIPRYQIDEAETLLEQRTKRLAIISSDPNHLQGLDPAKISAAQNALATALDKVRTAQQANAISWTVIAAASPKWAATVFPDLDTPQAQTDALWQEIFKATRVYEENPEQAWEKHEATLNEKANYLNHQQFDALHYSAPGTDLTVGLPKNHIWESAGSLNQAGEHFVANMPTEEVFTAPDYHRAEGVVTATKPLSYGGIIIDGMTFTFKEGAVTQVTAAKGEETLKRLVENHQGGKFLGEVAFVPHSSPISASGLIFNETLFDENASNHLALGQAYASSIQGGTDMSQEELDAAGLNRSTVHVDFMIGSQDMDVDGITKDGQRIPIFRQGEWAF